MPRRWPSRRTRAPPTSSSPPSCPTPRTSRRATTPSSTRAPRRTSIVDGLVADVQPAVTPWRDIPADESAQVRQWYFDIATAVAGAAKGVKPAEQELLDRARRRARRHRGGHAGGHRRATRPSGPREIVRLGGIDAGLHGDEHHGFGDAAAPVLSRRRTGAAAFRCPGPPGPALLAGRLGLVALVRGPGLGAGPLAGRGASLLLLGRADLVDDGREALFAGAPFWRRAAARRSALSWSALSWATLARRADTRARASSKASALRAVR